jgi:uncharacterized protein DUF4189
MTTIKKSRAAATALLVAAGATVVGLLGATAPANAAPDAYIALSIGFINENPPVTMAGGSAIAATQDQAATASLTNCVNNGGSHCVNQVIAKNACAAAASNDYGEMAGASDPSQSVAESKAKSMLSNQQGAKVIVSGCSNGASQPPPSQPPAPKLGPTVSWDLVVGGFVAHIKDRSGVSSQCTYVSENLNRSFALPANSTYDLRVVPAVPQFRDWTVTITCDNGTSTTATHHF